MIMFLCNNVVWESLSNDRERENPMLHSSVKTSLAQWRKRVIMKPRVQQTFSDLCGAQNEDEMDKQSSNWRGFFLLSNNPIYDCWKSSENMWTFDLQWILPISIQNTLVPDWQPHVQGEQANINFFFTLNSCYDRSVFEWILLHHKLVLNLNQHKSVDG